MQLKKSTFLYEVRRESIQQGRDDVFMIAAYNQAGKYIGNSELAGHLCEKIGIIPEAVGDSYTCTIGFEESSQKWYGWSHRVMAGFEKGYKIQEGDILLNSKKYKVGDKAKTLDEAKQMAITFSELIS